jgi:ubiquinone/menaquinone biosynthesis C-methylase UbiE
MHSRLQRIFTRVLKSIYHALYHQFSWSYNLAAWLVSLGRWNDCIDYFSNFIKTGTVLELGFGPGYLQSIPVSGSILICGLDASPQMCRKASRKMKRQNCTPHLVNGISQALPYPTAAFEQVVATFPAPYIVDPATLAEIYRILKPGGELRVLLTAWFKGTSLFQKIWAWLFRGVLNPGPQSSTISAIFEVQPWQVFIEKNEFQENQLLIISCLKARSLGFSQEIYQV